MKTEIKLPPEFVIALVKDWARENMPECLGGIADVSFKSDYGRLDGVEIELDTKLERDRFTVLEEQAPAPTPVPVPYHVPPEEATPEPPQEAEPIMYKPKVQPDEAPF